MIIYPISRIPVSPKPAAVPSLWNNIYDEIDERFQALNQGKQDVISLGGFSSLDSPQLTGTPVTPTAPQGTATNQIASTAFVSQAISDASGGTGSVFSCKAWINFNGNDLSIRGSGGVASVTRNNVGDYTINFSSPMANSNYCVNATSSVDHAVIVSQNENSVRVVSSYMLNVNLESQLTRLIDVGIFCVSIFN